MTRSQRDICQSRSNADADAPLLERFEEWMKAQILLSLDALESEAITCTACDDILGVYRIDYNGERFHCSAGRAYAFLQFINEREAYKSDHRS